MPSPSVFCIGIDNVISSFASPSVSKRYVLALFEALHNVVDSDTARLWCVHECEYKERNIKGREEEEHVVG